MEHRVFYLSDLMDCMIFLEDGVIKKDCSRQEAFSLSTEDLSQIGLRNFKLDQLHPTQNSLHLQISAKPLLSVSSISFSYKREKKNTSSNGLLSGVSFEAYAGEIIGIIGANGAGKTTLAKVCCGLLKENSGTISLNEKYLTPKKDLVRFILLYRIQIISYSEIVFGMN